MTTLTLTITAHADLSTGEDLSSGLILNPVQMELIRLSMANAMDRFDIGFGITFSSEWGEGGEAKYQTHSIDEDGTGCGGNVRRCLCSHKLD